MKTRNVNQGVGLFVALALSGQAAVFYQSADMPQGDHWNNTYWTNATQTEPVVPMAGNTYVNDLVGGTPDTRTGGGDFIGDSITFSNDGRLQLKHNGNISANLNMDDDTTILQGGGQGLLDGTLTGAGVLDLSNGQASRTIQLNTLILPGNTFSTIRASGGGTVIVNNPANTFNGLWDVQSGILKGVGFADGDVTVRDTATLNFDDSFFSISSKLVVENGGLLLLDEHVTVYSAELGGQTLPLGTHTGAQLKASYGSVIDSSSDDDATLTVTYGNVQTLTSIGAENMELSNYVVEGNADASGGQLVCLTGSEGSAKEQLFGFSAGYHDLTVGYFDETDGAAAFKVYLNEELIDSWLADRRLGSSASEAINYMERTIPQVYLAPGDILEVYGQGDGGEGSPLDSISFAESAVPVSQNVMTWNSDGTIASLILNGAEHLDSVETSAVEIRSFNGWTVGETTQAEAFSRDAITEFKDGEYNYMHLIFRMDSYDHHVALRLVDVEGLPKNDTSMNVRMVIPYLSSLGFQALDTNTAFEVNGGDELQIDWTELAQRNLLAGGQIALYAVNDTAAAQAEIAQMYTDNGKLDPYYDWIDGFSIIGSDADLFADPDGDGLNNLTEYALGGLPNLGNDGVDPAHGMLGDDFAIQYNRRRDAAARGLSYDVVKTDDLVSTNWSAGGVTEAGSVVLDADFESVTNSISTTGTTNGFLRLDIEFQK